MSLINKMLQDLDARADRPGAAPLPSDIRPVNAPARSQDWKRIAVLAGVAAVVALAGALGWRMLRPAPAPAPVTTEAKGKASAPVLPAPPATPAPVVAIEVPVAPRQEATLAAPPSVPVKAPTAAAAPASAPPVFAQAPRPEPRKSTRPAAQAPAGTAKAAAPQAAVGKGGREETPAQRAENAYRRALGSLEDGRVSEAIAGLQGALKIEPRHEAARQTLVSLLIEARRPEEAIRQLGAALALDPRQPAMAMLLARLQLERGSPGIDTLVRTLPYAAGNGDYHAFLAGALQHEERHREAVEQYMAALRIAPQNGVWWMGLGISLQAEKRLPEAADAFQKARNSGTLSPELQGFVERKLKQLAR